MNALNALPAVLARAAHFCAGARQTAAAGCLGLALLAGLGGSMPAQAAAVSGGVERVQPVIGGAGANPADADGAGRTLNKALTGDVSTGDKNLDLLLEIQRNSAVPDRSLPVARPNAPAAGPAAVGPSSTRVDALGQAPAQGQPAPPATQSLPRSGLLGPDSALPQSPADLGRANRNWGQTGGGIASTGSAGSYGGVQQTLPGDALRSDSGESVHLLDSVKQALYFVRDNLVWWIGSVALLLLLAYGFKAYSRRI